jgi:hypothetical protein
MQRGRARVLWDKTETDNAVRRCLNDPYLALRIGEFDPAGWSSVRRAARRAFSFQSCELGRRRLLLPSFRFKLYPSSLGGCVASLTTLLWSFLDAVRDELPALGGRQPRWREHVCLKPCCSAADHDVRESKRR